MSTGLTTEDLTGKHWLKERVRIPFDQSFRNFRFTIEWNRKFGETRFENFGQLLKVVLRRSSIRRTKNSAVNFRNFPEANGTTKFSEWLARAVNGKPHFISLESVLWLGGLNGRYGVKQNTDTSTSRLHTAVSRKVVWQKRKNERDNVESYYW